MAESQDHRDGMWPREGHWRDAQEAGSAAREDELEPPAGRAGWPKTNSKGKPFTRSDALRMMGFSRKHMERLDTFERLTRLTGVVGTDDEERRPIGDEV